MPTRQLRSSSSLLLQSLPTGTVIACRAFSQAAPRVWNDLPFDIRNSVTFDRFRSALRTHYYMLAFDILITWQSAQTIRRSLGDIMERQQLFLIILIMIFNEWFGDLLVMNEWVIINELFNELIRFKRTGSYWFVTVCRQRGQLSNHHRTFRLLWYFSRGDLNLVTE